MLRMTALFALGFLCALALISSVHLPLAAAPADEGQPAMQTPADGFTVHVTAPHMVNGHAMGPFHHYCKVYSGDTKIVCLIFDDSKPESMLTQVEWIWAKKLVRNNVSLSTWNKNWHDHAVEIAGGRVKVLDLPPDKAKGVADLVAGTDGLIYSFTMKDGVPTGAITIPQAVGHVPMKLTEWKNYEAAEAKQ